MSSEARLHAHVIVPEVGEVGDWVEWSSGEGPQGPLFDSSSEPMLVCASGSSGLVRATPTPLPILVPADGDTWPSLPPAPVPLLTSSGSLAYKLGPS